MIALQPVATQSRYTPDYPLKVLRNYGRFDGSNLPISKSAITSQTLHKVTVNGRLPACAPRNNPLRVTFSRLDCEDWRWREAAL